MTERHRSHLTRRLPRFRERLSTAEHTRPAAARTEHAAHVSPGHRGNDISTGATHNAVLGDWRALWQRDQQLIRIIRVRNISDDRTLLAITDPGSAPDLADMRERFPELSALWDEIRHQFWTQATQDTAR